MSTTRTIGRQGTLRLLALAAVVVGALLIVIAIRAQVSAPTPRPAGLVDPALHHSTTKNSHGSDGVTAGAKAPAPSAPAPLAASRPTSLQIPAIGVNTPVNPIGLASDGTIQVPQPGPLLNQAAWFKNSPTPGQPGPSVIEGHVDSVEGISVFFQLGAIRVGDKIVVHRRDGSVLTFRVNAIRNFLKSRFPTDLVYGGGKDGTDLGVPTLRLITCSDFDTAIHHHIGNEVVFAHLTKIRHRAHA